MRTAVYSRVSTDHQEVENQLIGLRAYCQASGLDLTVTFVDEAVSGKTAARPAFRQMMDAAYRREFDLLLFWSLDRFTREGALQTLQHLQKLTAWGVAWRSHTEPYFDSCGPFKEAVIAIIGTVAKLERVKIGERTKAGLARTRAKGTVLGRPRLEDARQKLKALRGAQPEISIRGLAVRLGVSKGTVERALKEPARVG
jgi:DNA invertase Pin-like site-specific DNA recombinase